MRLALAVFTSLVAFFAAVPGYAADAKKAAPPPPPPRFSFVAFGCMPYTEENFPGYERLLAEINRHRPAFSVHCGDTKAGSAAPTDAFLLQVRDWFNSIDGPVMYTPGDNEWTDVHRTGHDPLVWLDKVRKTYFSEERSLGRRPIPLVTQRRDPMFSKFVENARWSRDGVVFATVHVVGSNNNRDPKRTEAMAEFRERDAANAAWIRDTFAEARANQAPGVALFFQAQPLGARAMEVESGFAQFLATVEEEARAFARPVMLVHADEHRYRLEQPIRFRPDAEPLANVTRLETFGSGDLHAVIVTVDPGSPQVFLAGPLLVPGNPLPILPRKK